MKEKIQSRLVKMSQAPGIFASNKESFVFQICTLLSLLEPNLVHEDYYDLYKIAGIIYGNTFMNCNDSFDYDWGKKLHIMQLTWLNKNAKLKWNKNY